MTLSLTETDRKFIKGMEDAVALRGEHYTYPEISGSLVDDDYWHRGVCVYSTPDGAAACIVGLAIGLSGIGERPAYGAPSTEASEVIMPMGVGQAVADAADHAQGKQDLGQEWGAVLDAFKVRLADRLSDAVWEASA